MANEKYVQMLSVIEDIAKTANDAQITEQVEHTKQLLEAVHAPTIAVVGIGAHSRILLDAAEQICNEKVPSILNQAFETGYTCMILEDGEEALYRSNDAGCIQIADAGVNRPDDTVTDDLQCYFPCGVLQNNRLLLSNGVADDKNWRSFMENVDTLTLRVNATAVMNQAERNWLDNELIPLFGEKHVAVWIDLLDQLNTEEDQTDVMQTVQNALSKRNLQAPIFSSAADAGTWMLSELNSTNIRDNFLRRILKICLKTVNEQITAMQQTEAISEAAIEKAIHSLDSQRSQMELLGEIAVSTTVLNTYVNLKVSAKEGVKDFNTQAVESICKKISEAEDKELETLEPKIQSYLRKIWERYQQEMNAKLNQETTACYNQLMEQMERDAEKMIANMDEETQKVLDAAINRPVAVQGGALIRPSWEQQGANSLVKLRTETRNMMLLAIPMAFASPWLAVATFFGAKYYKKSQSAKRGEEFRNALKDQVRTSCDEVLEDILSEVDRNFENASNQTATAVREAYSGLADKLISELSQLNSQQQDLNTRINTLKQIQSTTIPGMMCSL